MSLLSCLMLLKIGFYAPAPDMPLKSWAFIGINAIEERGSSRPLGLELGITGEAKRNPAVVHGFNGYRTIWKPAYLLGVKYPVTKNDLDAAIGAKLFDNRVTPYLSMSLKLGSVREQ